MKTLLTFLGCLTIGLAFSQPAPKPVYKDITANYFSLGDRIWMGEAVKVEGVKTATKDFTLTFSDSMEVYRKFVQSNPNLAFRLNFYWRHEGTKYPGRSEAVKDTVIEYLTTLSDEGMNSCQQMIYSFQHKVNKQTAILQLELEVIGAQTINGMGHDKLFSIGLPDWNVLYRDYDNKVSFAVNSFADSVWLVGQGCVVTNYRNGSASARITTTGREAFISVVSVLNGDTTIHVRYPFRVLNLPPPSIYIGNVPIDEIEQLKDSLFNQLGFLRAGYSPSIPLNVTFDVKETVIKIGDKTIINKGKLLGDDYVKAYEEAEAGTVIIFESVGFAGPTSGVVLGPWKHIKKSPKGTKLAPLLPTFSKGC